MRCGVRLSKSVRGYANVPETSSLEGDERFVSPRVELERRLADRVDFWE